MKADLQAGIPDSEPRNRLADALNELLPAMTADGGGVEIVSVENGAVTLRLMGSCNFCPSRQLSATALERGIQQRVPDVATINIIYPQLPSLTSIERENK